MTMISERTAQSEVLTESHLPLVDWHDCVDVVLDDADTLFDGECSQHDGCRSIL